MDDFPDANIHQRLADLASVGDFAGVALLLALVAKPCSKQHRSAGHALVLAASNGHAKCVELLIPATNPKADSSSALREAAASGHSECVKLLIPVSDPKAGCSIALRETAASGHAECVELLIPVSDPKVENSMPLRWAIANDQAECARLLAPVSIMDHAVVSSVLRRGNAKILSLMIANEPLFLAGADFPRILGDAIDRGCSELAALLATIIEQEAIAGHLSKNTNKTPFPRGPLRL